MTLWMVASVVKASPPRWPFGISHINAAASGHACARACRSPKEAHAKRSVSREVWKPASGAGPYAKSVPNRYRWSLNMRSADRGDLFVIFGRCQKRGCATVRHKRVKRCHARMLMISIAPRTQFNLVPSKPWRSRGPDVRAAVHARRGSTRRVRDSGRLMSQSRCLRKVRGVRPVRSAAARAAADVPLAQRSRACGWWRWCRGPSRCRGSSVPPCISMKALVMVRPRPGAVVAARERAVDLPNGSSARGIPPAPCQCRCRWTLITRSPPSRAGRGSAPAAGGRELDGVGQQVQQRLADQLAVGMTRAMSR